MNQNQTSPKPADAEQPSGKGLDETTCSPYSFTPETDAIADDGATPWNLKTSQFLMLARRLERERNDAFRLLRVIEEGHRNIKSRLYYHACDTDPCEWCLKVRASIFLENDKGEIPT